MDIAFTDSEIARLSRGEIEVMDVPSLKSIVKRIGVKGVKGVTAKKDTLVWLLDEYKGSVTAEGIVKELPQRNKEWLSGFSLPRLRTFADVLNVPKKGVRRSVLIGDIYDVRDREDVDFGVQSGTIG